MSRRRLLLAEDHALVGEGLRVLRRVREAGGRTAQIARYILSLDEQAMAEHDGYAVGA